MVREDEAGDTVRAGLSARPMTDEEAGRLRRYARRTYRIALLFGGLLPVLFGAVSLSADSTFASVFAFLFGLVLVGAAYGMAQDSRAALRAAQRSVTYVSVGAVAHWDRRASSGPSTYGSDPSSVAPRGFGLPPAVCRVGPLGFLVAGWRSNGTPRAPPMAGQNWYGALPAGTVGTVTFVPRLPRKYRAAKRPLRRRPPKAFVLEVNGRPLRGAALVMVSP